MTISQADVLLSEADVLLSEEEACTRLNLPQFLVREFVSYEFNGRKLEPVDRKAKPRQFTRETVDEFKAHLGAPWPGDGRPAIPKFIERYLDLEVLGRCGICREERENYDYAHIRDWAKSRCHSPHNLIRLCVSCHRSHGNDPKKLEGAKELALRRVFVQQIHLNEERVETLEVKERALRWLVFMCVVVIASFPIKEKAHKFKRERHVDPVRLANRLVTQPKGVLQATRLVRINCALNDEAAELGGELKEAFVKAGWNVEYYDRPDIAGHGIHILGPPTMAGWLRQRQFVYLIAHVHTALTEEGASPGFFHDEFYAWTVGSYEWAEHRVTINVLADE